jgi:hypothetical protein
MASKIMASPIERERKYYARWSVVLLVLIIPLSVAGFVANSINSQIEVLAQAACDTEPALHCTSPALAGEPAVENDSALKSIANVRYTDDMIFFDDRMLDYFLLGYRPFTPHELGTAYKCLDKVADIRDCTDGRHYIAGTFEGVIYFARVLKTRSNLVYSILGVYILPILYAMLGTCAYGLRNLSQDMPLPSDPLGPIHSQMRLLLAALAGVVVTLFTDFAKGFSLSPLAIAFLAGYAVEIFFSTLDALVEASGPKLRSKAKFLKIKQSDALGKNSASAKNSGHRRTTHSK